MTAIWSWSKSRPVNKHARSTGSFILLLLTSSSTKGYSRRPRYSRFASADNPPMVAAVTTSSEVPTTPSGSSGGFHSAEQRIPRAGRQSWSSVTLKAFLIVFRRDCRNVSGFGPLRSSHTPP